ncbi:hypothetical protein, partial [Streptococcus pneumoniae]
MRGFNNKIKSVYQELTNSKEKFGSFYKTLIHLHTPVSYDYKLFSNWTATKYRKITEDELYPQLFTPNLKTIQNPCLSLDPGWFLFSPNGCFLL